MIVFDHHDVDDDEVASRNGFVFGVMVCFGFDDGAVMFGEWVVWLMRAIGAILSTANSS